MIVHIPFTQNVRVKSLIVKLGMSYHYLKFFFLHGILLVRTGGLLPREVTNIR